MSRKTVSGLVLTFFLIGMLTLAFRFKPVEAYPEAWTVDDHELTGFSKTRNAMTEITEIDPADPLRVSMNPRHRLTIKSFFRECLDTRLMDDFRLPYEATDKWDLSNEAEWNDFTSIDDNSAELVIGLDDRRPNSYSELGDLTRSCGGEFVNTISVDGKVIAVAVDIPYGAMSIFASEVQIAGLSRYVEPNVRFEINFLPNDPGWAKQWGPCIIEADYAWNTTRGDPSLLVAVIDTGVDWDHPDLAANYVSLGYDWVNNDPDPMDDHGHGTHCAGVIAAVLNNGIGIAGLAQVQIMAEKGLGPEGGGWSDDLAKAIVHAVDQGADILSCSWGSYARSTVIHEALKYAYEHDVLVIGAAGNDATSVKHYPAAYDEVAAVTATDGSDNPAGFSNFGEWVEVAAPGVHVYSTVWDDSYMYMSGTSMSAPHVSGVAALVWSQFPSMTRDQMQARLRYTADDLGDPGFDVYYGYGRLNARRAVEQAPFGHDVVVLNWEKPQYVNLGSQVTINSSILNMGESDESGITVQLLVNDSAVDSEIVSSLASGASTSISCSWTPMVKGVYNITSYVVPVLGETVTENNALSAHVIVRIPGVIGVPEDYGTIQGAVDAAVDGDTIFVASGTYYENVWIDKENLALLGEDQASTIINGRGVYDVLLVAADNVKINGFTIRNSGGWNPSVYPPFSGIIAYGSNGHTISNTTTSNNCMGICLFQGNGITLRDNKMTGNMYNFGVEGYHIMDFKHDIDTSNSVNGKPIYYWINQQANQFPAEAGYVAAINSSDITVKDLDLTNNYQGVLFAYSTGSLIEKVRASSNYIDIHLVHSHANTVVTNTATHSQIGIQLQDSNGNNISHNTITYNYEGVSLYCSSNNTIGRNNLCDNSFGLSAQKSSNNTIEHNGVFSNTYGIYLRKSCYNTLRNSNMTYNNYSFGVTGSHLSHFVEDIDTSNTVNGKPVYYWVKQKGKQIPVDAGYVAVVNSTNITVRNLNLTNNLQGVLFAYTTDSLIENVKTSNNTYSIYLYGSSNNTITGNTVTSKSKRGIQLIKSNNNTIGNNMITNNYIGVGLWLTAVNNTICNNTISNCTVGGVGLYLDHSTENTVGDNIITNNGFGIELYQSGSNMLTNNSMTGNSYNFGVYGGSLSDFIQDIDTSNTVDGKPIYYGVTQHSQKIPSEAGYVAIINSTDISVENLNLANNARGILFAYTTNSTIMNVNASDNSDGILLWNSDSNTISGNTIANNWWDGISLYHSDYNTIAGNMAIDNGFGADIYESHENLIDSNTFMENIIGIMVYYSDNNVLSGNNVTGGGFPGSLAGITLTESKGNVLSGNAVSDNRFFIGAGIYLELSSNNNIIVQNTLANNAIGISLGWGGLYGMKDQNNNNTIHHNNLIENTKQVLSLNSINTWDDSYPSGGNYWSDYDGNDTYTGPHQNMTGSDGMGDASYVIDESNRDRYPLINPWKPPIPGDVNKDHRVDMRDVSLAARAYGSHLNHSRWNPIVDVNQDDKVDMRDIALIASHFGETCT